MKVKELVESLKECNQEAEVCILDLKYHPYYVGNEYREHKEVIDVYENKEEEIVEIY